MEAIEQQYKDAISSLSERLGTDKWFLGSTYVPSPFSWRPCAACAHRSLPRRSPTALDALVFAYLHCILHSKEHALRFEVTRRVNLVAWERRVQSQVRGAFRARPSVHA